MVLNEKLRFLSRDKRDNVEINSNKSQIYLLQQTWLKVFFLLWFLGFSKALTNWVKTQNYKLENMRLIRKTLKKKKKKKPTKKKTNKQEYPPTTFAVCKNGLRRKESSGAKERSVNNRRVYLRELVILWRFRELKSKGKPTLGWLEYMLYLCTYTVKLFFDFWMCFTILYLFCS